MSEARVLAADLLQGAARTDPGRARTNNEDLPLIDPARGIFGVIDGVGGEAGGEVAAGIARDVILQRLARPLGTPAERVREAIAIANNEIFRRAQESVELRGMACVITLAIVADGRLVVGHVGDTRLYKIRGDGFRKVTRDHSPVGEREDAGELGEVDAMRHPRRNEVFRDVGSVYRDKDEQEFVDIIDEPAERDSALLVCSDGLSDMLPSPTIVHIVRQHAGDPARVVEALVAAANDAGGKDNVTVVYAEGPQFAASVRGDLPDTMTPTEPLGDGLQLRASAAAQPRVGGLRYITRAIVNSRTTWFVIGTLIGVLGALGLMFYVAKMQVPAAQTLVVAADGSALFTRIAQAMAEAKPGDVVRIEPGEYEEQVMLADGVDLVARVSGSVTIRRPAGLAAPAPVLAAGGPLNVRVSGVRIVTAPGLQGGTGVRIDPGANVTLELVEIVGPLSRAIALAPGSSVTVQGSRVSLAGEIIGVPEDAQASLVNNVFVRTAPSPEPPISAGGASRLTMTGNVFAGFDAEIVKGLSPARRKEILASNIVVPPPQAPRRRPEAGR
ncbi:MAG TPA: protein phosphatase 2C domain-containing protein [Vicinamibacterales bacterium]|nr:protein phosphatase 2C domain-containing protein [Vicinamibacterales bacterium]